MTMTMNITLEDVANGHLMQTIVNKEITAGFKRR